jgi:hypothetical protein
MELGSPKRYNPRPPRGRSEAGEAREQSSGRKPKLTPISGARRFGPEARANPSSSEQMQADFSVATRRNPTGPSLPTIKRLFAHSGNRCAFPRCTTALFEGTTVIGKICHIKAANPGGPRYDDQQTAAERHGYDNLMLLCGTHHTVIDDDEEAYTVERLRKMKAEHEKGAAQIDDAFAERAAQLLIAQTVVSVNQSGGITAHTVHADTINLYPPSVGDTRHPSWQLKPVDSHISSFIEDGQTLCRPRSLLGMEDVLDIIWYNQPQFFLRLIPREPPPKPWNFTAIKAMIDSARLLPLPSYYESYFSSPNQFGAVVLNLRRVENQDSAEQITQVSRYGEIWGIDKRSAVDGSKLKFGEKTIAQALKNYLSFVRDQLGLKTQLTIVAGFTSVQGFEFHHPMKQNVWWKPPITHCNCPNIVWDDEIHDVNREPKLTLLPFFDTVWDCCGLSRSDWFPEDYQ